MKYSLDDLQKRLSEWKKEGLQAIAREEDGLIQLLTRTPRNDKRITTVFIQAYRNTLGPHEPVQVVGYVPLPFESPMPMRFSYDCQARQGQIVVFSNANVPQERVDGVTKLVGRAMDSPLYLAQHAITLSRMKHSNTLPTRVVWRSQEQQSSLSLAFEGNHGYVVSELEAGWMSAVKIHKLCEDIDRYVPNSRTQQI